MSGKDYYLYVDGQSVTVSKEVYKEYMHYERKERYFMEDLKKESTEIDPKTQIETVIPSREDSYERLLEANKQFEAYGEVVEEHAICSVFLEQVLASLTREERELIHELYFLQKTERQVSDSLHMAKTTLRRRHSAVLKKLRRLLEKNS